MSRSKASGRTQPRPWQPMRRAVPVILPELAEMARDDPALAKTIEDSGEMWKNDLYVVSVRRFAEGGVERLSIRRDDRKAARDWRHFQRIKNDIAGPEVEAVELFPAESRLVDSANQFWLWCMPPGMQWPFGFKERAVADQDPEFPLSRQRPLEETGQDRRPDHAQ